MKDRTHDQDLDMLSTYDQDVLHQSVFVATEMLVELESQNHYLHRVFTLIRIFHSAVSFLGHTRLR
jgi:hypothetical protein